MSIKQLFITTFVFVSAGLVFSGYLSAVKFFTKTCAFNEGCPYFLGYPACWYGFAMYLAMFVMSAMYLRKARKISAIKTNLFISVLGIIFAGRFAIEEIMNSQATGVLGFSTCVYGLIFYVLICIFSLITLTQMKKVNTEVTH